LNKNIPGSLVETGVWKGGMGMWMKSILKYYRSDKLIYLFDTFEYFPPPSNSKVDLDIHNITQFLFQNMSSVAEIQDNFRKYGILDKVVFVKGDFFQTVPKIKNQIQSISLLRLDSDYYDSTLFILENLYQNVSPGGYVIVDDYNNKYVDCKKAVDDFREKYGINDKIIDHDGGSVYWQKK
jgi:O-methyltransferase